VAKVVTSALTRVFDARYGGRTTSGLPDLVTSSHLKK
jgi:hypothetical protein